MAAGIRCGSSARAYPACWTPWQIHLQVLGALLRTLSSGLPLPPPTTAPSLLELRFSHFSGHWSEQACSNTDWQPHPRNFWFKSPGVAPDLHNQQVPNLMLLVCRIDCCPRENSFLVSWPEQTISVFLKGLGASQRKGSFFFFFRFWTKKVEKGATGVCWKRSWLVYPCLVF